jgi:hypothetical protein
VRRAAVLLAFVLAGLPALLPNVAAPLRAQTQNAPVSLSGEWVVYLSTPNAAPWRGALAQEGTKIAGYMGNETAEYPVTGSYDGSQVKFKWSIVEAGEDIEISITGKFDREAITGTATVGEVEDVPVTAQRTSR